MVYDQNHLYATDRVMLYQLRRDTITFKDWKESHYEKHGLSGVQLWSNKLGKNIGALACGGAETFAPNFSLEQAYSIVNSSVVKNEIGYQITTSGHDWIKDRAKNGTIFGGAFPPEAAGARSVSPL